MAEFTKTEWVNDQSPDITAEQLNRMEAGIFDAITSKKKFATFTDMPAPSPANQNWMAYVEDEKVSYINFDGATWTAVTASPSIGAGERLTFKGASGSVVGEIWMVEGDPTTDPGHVTMWAAAINGSGKRSESKVAEVKPAPPVQLVMDTPGDTNGLVYYLGTNGGTEPFENPATKGPTPPLGVSINAPIDTTTLIRLSDRDLNGGIANNPFGGNPAYMFDLGAKRIKPTHVTYRRGGAEQTAWFPASLTAYGTNNEANPADPASWTMLGQQANPAPWPIEYWFDLPTPGIDTYYRYIWLEAAGFYVNANGSDGPYQGYYFVASEMELYGELVDAA